MSCPGNSMGDCFAANWARRVQNNGGARPSQATINAAGVFWDALQAAGIQSKMKAVNLYAPDSLTAAITPFIKGPGLDPWTNTAFVAGDLSVNGLKGNGSTKWLDTGIDPNLSLTNNDTHATLYLHTAAVANAADQINLGSQTTSNQNGFMLHVDNPNSATGASYHYNYNLAGGQTQFAKSGPGFYCASKRSGVDGNVYFANGATAFASLATMNTTAGNVTFNAHPITVFGLRNNGVMYGMSSSRLSFISIGQGLTQSESLALYNAVQALRIALGGGYVHEATDWASRVVANGGAAPSVPTVNAVRTFVDTLKAASIWTKMKAVNVVAPDNLIAAISPLVVGTGADPWTNQGGNFVAGDLTVNGLKGNGINKSLNTGFIPSAGGLTTTSGGLVIYCSEHTDSGGQQMPLGVFGPAMNSGFMLTPKDSTGSVMEIYLWRWDGAGRDSIAVSALADPRGYYSGQRTGASALALFHAKSAVAHYVVGSSALAQNGTVETLRPLSAWAANIAGATGNFTLGRYSFMAITMGMTEAEDLILYNAVQALRTALGGGYV